MTLPKTKTSGIPKLEQLVCYCHGPPKIGKTSFWNAVFPDALFVTTDGGTKLLKTYEEKIGNWSQFVRVVKDLQKSKQFRVVILDLIEHLHYFAEEKFCRQNGIDSPEGYGGGKLGTTGWRLKNKIFSTPIYRLLATGRGVVFISNTIEQELLFSKGKQTKLVPALTGSPRKIIMPLCDVIAYVGMKRVRMKVRVNGKVKSKMVNQRVLHTRGTEDFEAGSRGTVDSPLFPPVIPLDAKAFRVTYQKLIKGA